MKSLSCKKNTELAQTISAILSELQDYTSNINKASFVDLNFIKFKIFAS
jgi:hypothetical protein